MTQKKWEEGDLGKGGECLDEPGPGLVRHKSRLGSDNGTRCFQTQCFLYQDLSPYPLLLFPCEAVFVQFLRNKVGMNCLVVHTTRALAKWSSGL